MHLFGVHSTLPPQVPDVERPWDRRSRTFSPAPRRPGSLASKQDQEWIEATAMTERLVVLGAGTAGTMIVNKLRRKLPHEDWDITVVDRDDVHAYQPGYLLVPFGKYDASQLEKPRQELLADGVELVLGEIDRVDTGNRVVRL